MFTTPKLLYRQGDSLSGTPVYQCPQCGYVFTRLQLISHNSKRRYNGTYNYCPKCKINFNKYPEK